MRVVIQRVGEASVSIAGTIKARIQHGLLVLVAFEESDTEDDVEWVSGKVVRMRIFNDDAGLMNRSLTEVGGELLVVSQFTLFASTRKGNRPSFIRSAKPDIAVPLYEKFLEQLSHDLAKPVAAGEFGADMKVSLCNDGPVTILVDSKARE